MCVFVCVQNVGVYLHPQQLPLKHNDKHAHSNALYVKQNRGKSVLVSNGGKSYLFFVFFPSVPTILCTNHINTVDVIKFNRLKMGTFIGNPV